MSEKTHLADRRWLALALLTVTQFMIVLDVAIVNVALPAIQEDLNFDVSDLQWVASAYALTFGGFLLLGGRSADLLGRRRVFMAGVVLFSVASLAAGLATSDTALIAFRAIQGVGAAIVAPAALSILTTTFAEGRDRNLALGIWGAVSGLGGAAGVLLGGVLTDALSWEWVFLVNVPVGVVLLALTPFLLRESRSDALSRSFDIPGAVSVTGGLVLLVYAIVGTSDDGWTSARSLGLFAASVILLVAFLVIESRAKAPLLPLRIFRLPTVAGANVVGMLLGATIFSMFFFLSLYMQQVLGYSAMKTGVAYLATALTIIVTAAISQGLVTKVGVRNVMIAGAILQVMGLAWFTQVSVDGTYVSDLLPGFILAGAGLGFSFVPVTIAALAGVQNRDAGVASGLINTSQQIGGALGVSALVTIATQHTTNVAGSGTAGPEALVEGFQRAFAVGAGLAVVGLVVTLFMIRPEREQESGELASAAAAA